jgi:tetratricopeptide (TPR) repeat protein
LIVGSGGQFYSGMPSIRTLERPGLIASLLVLAALAVYLPLVYLGFLNFDDDLYVTRNPQVQSGLTWSGLAWAFTHLHAANWHPVTWLSHMLDCQLYGLNPVGHHFTSFLFHAANTVLLFFWLRSLTGAFWRSAFVAALFALHPLHVESVAWVAERKDVLSAFFGLLSLWAYTKYARVTKVQGRGAGGEIRNPRSETRRKPEARNQSLAASAQADSRAAARVTRSTSLYYTLALVLFGLGLMSKPMLVTWPCLMLLLDYWPLRRSAECGMRNAESGAGGTGEGRTLPWMKLVWEKIPFFALTIVSSLVTLWAQGAGGALVSMTALPLGLRTLNALDAYFRYLGKFLWPTDLAAIYTYVGSRPAVAVFAALLVMIAVTGLAFCQRKARPYLAVGWAWYLGTLVPVIGLVQVGNQVMADRYTYLPAIGLFIIVAWGAAEIARAGPSLRVMMVTAALAALVACALAAQSQLLYWQNSETLFRHALAVTRNNFVAWNNLGFFLAGQRQLRQAEACYRAAIEINPAFQESWNNLGCTLASLNRYDEAIATYETALRVDPGFVKLHNNLAVALAASGRIEEAKVHCREVARLDPRSAEPHSNLGALLARQGEWDEAIAEFRRAIALDPALSEARCGLAGVLAKQGHSEEAVRELSEWLTFQPGCAAARLQLAIILSLQGKLDQAIAAYADLLRANPNDSAAHYHLALALSRQGKTRETVQHYRAAIQALPNSPEALNNLAWILATNPDPQFRDGREAVELAERACRLTAFKEALMVGTLAAAYAEARRFPEAVATAERAKALAKAANDPDAAAQTGKLLELYRSGLPYRDTP